jgi:hypothetical protein
MVERVSPVEALRLAEGEQSHRKIKKNTSVTWWGMAVQNVLRNWKKGLIVMLSIASSSDKFCAIAWDESINCLISVALLESIMDTLPTKRLVNNSDVNMIAITAIIFLARFIFIKRFVNNRNVSLFSTFTI